MALTPTRSLKIKLAVFGIAAYFLTAYWLKVTYATDAENLIVPNVAGKKVLLLRPYKGFNDSDMAVIATDRTFADLADTADDDDRSTIVIYENDQRLGPGHSVHLDVGKLGEGRFSHWRFNYSMFLFSSSDNTDPRTNGRSYWAVKPDAAEMAAAPSAP